MCTKWKRDHDTDVRVKSLLICVFLFLCYFLHFSLLLEDCQKDPAIGGPGPTCLAHIERYFYNSSSMNCEIFIYGGCGGNLNNFGNDTECMDSCQPEGEE